MSLFPNTVDDTDNSRYLKARMQAFHDQTLSYNLSFWTESSIDSRIEAGDGTIWPEIYANIPNLKRRNFNFNRVRRIVSMISGAQRRNRKSTVAVPVENGDADTADQFTKLLAHINKNENVLETISEAFQGALITGMNLLHVWIDFRSDPVSGDIKLTNCHFNEFLIDPFFRKADLSDCLGIYKRSFVTKVEAMSLLPDKKDDINSMNVIDNRDGKFYFMPEAFNWGTRNLLTYDEFYYRSYRNQKLLIDSQTGEVLEWRGQDEDGLKRFMQQYPTVTVVEQEVPTVNLAIVVNGHVMYDDRNPLGVDQYPFVPVMAYYNPQIALFPLRIQGVVRGLRDAQLLYTRRKIIELDILESQVNSGWIYKENALIDPKSVFTSGQGVGIALKEDAQMTDVQQILAPQIPPSMIELSKLLAQEVEEISGVNSELLGSATDDKAGILSMLRQGAGLTTLQGLFDQLDRSQRLLGKVMIDIIQCNWTPGKVQRIVEQQPTPQFYNKAFGRYDCAVEEGLNTTTQRQMQFAQLLQLREVGVQVPDDVLLEACTVQDKSKLVKSIQAQQQQAAQAQQMQLQAQIQEQQARTELAHSRAVADQGLGLERLSRIQENQALAEERRAESVADENRALLDLVKALKEIDGLDLSHMKELLTLHAMIKGEEVANKKQVEQQSTAPTPQA